MRRMAIAAFGFTCKIDKVSRKQWDDESSEAPEQCRSPERCRQQQEEIRYCYSIWGRVEERNRGDCERIAVGE
jgi:hypothetical protein